jgi:hypothetical protein
MMKHKSPLNEKNKNKNKTRKRILIFVHIKIGICVLKTIFHFPSDIFVQTRWRKRGFCHDDVQIVQKIEIEKQTTVHHGPLTFYPFPFLFNSSVPHSYESCLTSAKRMSNRHAQVE